MKVFLREYIGDFAQHLVHTGGGTDLTFDEDVDLFDERYNTHTHTHTHIYIYIYIYIYTQHIERNNHSHRHSFINAFIHINTHITHATSQKRIRTTHFRETLADERSPTHIGRSAVSNTAPTFAVETPKSTTCVIGEKVQRQEQRLCIVFVVILFGVQFPLFLDPLVEHRLQNLHRL
jgi:hypothetical protein